MVRIYTEAGEFSLPEDFSIEIEISNPMLSSDGSASIPFTVPATPGNLVAAGRPDLLSRMYSFRNGVECIVQYGAFQIQGNLMIYNRKNEMCRVGKRNAMVLVENEM